MNLDTEKPVFIKKQFVDARNGNVYPAGDRPYILAAIPEKYQTDEYCTQETVTVEVVPAVEKAVDVRPLSANNMPATNLAASTVVMKESQLPASPETTVDIREFKSETETKQNLKKR